MAGWQHSRVSRHERGYGKEWDKLRLLVLKRDHYLCQCTECKREARVTPATHVDHIIPKAQQGSDDMSNLQAINAACHARKSKLERGFRDRTPPNIGLDGWPIEQGR